MKFPFFKRQKEELPEWFKSAPREGMDRKLRSEALLKGRGVPINAWLPIVEGEAEATVRGADEIVKRIVALTLVAVKGEGALSSEQLHELINRFRATECFSPKEIAFIKDPSPLDMCRIQFCWRYEALWVMLWSLKFVESLSYPDRTCDVPFAVGFLRDLGREGLLQMGVLRAPSELLEEADLIFRCHWAVRDAQLTGKPIGGGLAAGVVMERHYAMNWLVQGAEWDEVDTST